jgi:lambda family phage portal protein
VAKQRAPSTLADRIVGYFNPQAGLVRMQARARLALAGGYTGARGDRAGLKAWNPFPGSADADQIGDLPSLRARTRDLARNNPIACGATNTAVTSVVGTGLTVKAQIDRAYLGLSEDEAQAWEAQAERIFRVASAQLDLTRAQDFAGLQALIFRSTLDSGDVFTVRRYKKRRGDLLGLKLQIIEADRVEAPQGTLGSTRIVAGVERDEDGAPTAYHVRSDHPGDVHALRADTKWSRLPAFGSSGERLVLHHYDRLRPGQTRGVPYLAPVIEPLKQLGRFTDAELMAAVIGGMNVAAIESEDDETSIPIGVGGGDGDSEEPNQLEFDYGAVWALAPGEKIKFLNSNRPNQAIDPFVHSIMRFVGVALEIPIELIVKHFTRSYSAARASLLEAWRFFLSRRRWLAGSLCQPVWEMVIAEAVATGLLEAPGFFRDPMTRAAYLRTQWIGPAPGQIDELKEAKAAGERIKIGVSNEELETAQLTGQDWEAVHEQRARELRMRRAAEMDADSAAAEEDDADEDPDAGDQQENAA